MPQRILSSLTWKAGVAVAVTALAAGTGASTFHLVNDTHASDNPGAEVRSHGSTTTTTAGDGTTTATADDDSGDTDATTAATTNEHPDNFGAIVSEDAQDGGVDGQEISDMAHERNDARRAAADHATADDHPTADEADDADEAGDDHRADAGTEHGQDDSHPEEETDD